MGPSLCFDFTRAKSKRIIHQQDVVNTHIGSMIGVIFCAVVIASVLGSLKHVYMNNPNKTDRFCSNDLCFVTAFRDIDRGNWKQYQRSTDEYLKRFGRLLSLRHPLVIFIDNRYTDDILRLVAASDRSTLSTQIIPFDDEFLSQHIDSWQRLPREKEIMSSARYRNRVRHRLSHPEHRVPEYTIINHCKVDFVRFVVDEVHKQDKCGRYAWIDFGYIEDFVKVPIGDVPTLGETDLDKVAYVVLRHPIPSDVDRLRVLTEAPDVIAGGFFCASPKTMVKFAELYHSILGEFQDADIADDDQAVVLAAYFLSPALFEFRKGEWKTAFETFGSAALDDSSES